MQEKLSYSLNWKQWPVWHQVSVRAGWDPQDYPDRRDVRGRQDSQDPQDPRDRQGLLGHRDLAFVPRVLWDPWVHRVHRASVVWVRRVPRVPRDRLVLQGYQDPSDVRGRQDHQDPQGRRVPFV